MKRMFFFLATAILSVLSASRQQKLSDKELASVIWAMGQMDPAGETLFTHDPKGNCRYQFPGDRTWCDTVLKYIRLMAIQH